MIHVDIHREWPISTIERGSMFIWLLHLACHHQPRSSQRQTHELSTNAYNLDGIKAPLSKNPSTYLKYGCHAQAYMTATMLTLKIQHNPNLYVSQASSQQLNATCTSPATYCSTTSTQLAWVDLIRDRDGASNRVAQGVATLLSVHVSPTRQTPQVLPACCLTPLTPQPNLHSWLV